MSYIPFLNALFPEGDGSRDLGYVVLATYPGGTFNRDKGPTETHYYAWPSQRDEIARYCLDNSNSDIYISAALYKERGNRKASNISHQWAVYADADSLDLKKVKAEPTLTVETSPGRHHLYWVTSTDDPKALVQVSKSVAHAHAKDGCDTGGWDAGQLLRMPGTMNNKPGLVEPFLVNIKRHGEPYSLEALSEIYPPIEITRTTTEIMPSTEEYASSGSIKEAFEVLHRNPGINRLYTTQLSKEEGHDRSGTMWRLLSDLSRSGVRQEVALWIAWESGCNKYKQDGRPIEDLWNELCRAYNDPDNQPVEDSFDIDLSFSPEEVSDRSKLDQFEENPENKVTEFVSTISILTDQERIQVPENTFLDQYVRWAETRTDAPTTYHRAGAITLLCAIFGEFGSCPTKFDSNLTLWFLLLGPTTRARKSTAMNLWVDLVSELQTHGYSYLLGSDVTSEALSVLLPKRDGTTSLFYRDEAHGLLYEQDKKRYLAGLREHMTELYGGRVRMRLRATMDEGSKERDDEDESSSAGNIRTNFMMFLCGTMDQVTSALTIEDYQSGHLARFLVSEADPPPMTEEDMFIEQYDGIDRTDDIHRRELLDQLAIARSYWEHKCGGRGNNRIVPFEPDAWKRFNKAKWHMYQIAQSHDMSEVLLPTVDRMGNSLMKCAILLAMVESSPKVEMPHVLKAMELAEGWYAATATIAGKIMHSSWSARQEEIINKVRSNRDGVTQAELFRAFRNQIPLKDFTSDLEVLTKAGIIRRIDEPTGRTRYLVPYAA